MTLSLQNLFVIIFTFSGCASSRLNTLTLMASSAAVVGTLGAITSPGNENKLTHAALWAGAAGTVSAIASLYIFDEESKKKEAEFRIKKLERELSLYKETGESELLSSQAVGFGTPLPEKFRHLVRPGKWNLYKIDRWAQSGDNELIHQDLLFQFSQPALNPAPKPLPKEGEKTP